MTYTRVSVGVIPSLEATLYVRGIKVDPVNTYGVAGESSSITCKIGGDRPDKVVWTYKTKGQQLNDTSMIFQKVIE